MNNVWQPDGINFFLEERKVNSQIDELPVGVYEMQSHPKIGLYLTKVYDGFTFPYKVYGVETKFIDWIVKTWNEKNTNLGLLLNGIKGTGKTVTAEIICNKLNLPVILVNQPFNIGSFVNSIDQEVILFFDEYEKVFDKKSLEGEDEGESSNPGILTLMDGVLSSEHRKMFILTTNEPRVNENMIGRPSRIRYIKTFGNLQVETILEIVNDKLKYPEFKDKIVDFVSKLEIITIDIVKSIVEEVNIHQVDPIEFKDFFNTPISEELSNIFHFEKGKKGLIHMSNVKVEPKWFSKMEFENGNEMYVYVNDRDFLIHKVIDSDTVEVYQDQYHMKDKDGKLRLWKWKVERTQPRHKSFNHYAF